MSDENHSYITQEKCDKICEVINTKIENPNGIKLNKKSFKCCFCHKTYSKKQILNKHIIKQHYDFNSKEKNKIMRAVNETWIEQVHKLNIFVEMKKINDNVITIKKCKKGKVKRNNDLTKAICDYCEKLMWKKSIIKHIEECHYYIYKYRCKKCLNSYKRKYMLTNHVCGKPISYRRPRNMKINK